MPVMSRFKAMSGGLFKANASWSGLCRSGGKIRVKAAAANLKGASVTIPVPAENEGLQRAP